MCEFQAYYFCFGIVVHKLHECIKALLFLRLFCTGEQFCVFYIEFSDI